MLTLKVTVLILLLVSYWIQLDVSNGEKLTHCHNNTLDLDLILTYVIEIEQLVVFPHDPC